MSTPIWVDLLPDMKAFGKEYAKGTKEAVKGNPVEPEVKISQKAVTRLRRELRELEQGKQAALSLKANLDVSKVDKKILEVKSSIARSQAAKIGVTIDTKSLIQETQKEVKKAVVPIKVEPEIEKFRRDLKKLEQGREAALSLDASVNTKTVDRKILELKTKIARSKAAEVGLTINPAAALRDAQEDGKKAGRDYGQAFTKASKSAMRGAGRAAAGTAKAAGRGAAHVGAGAAAGAAVAGQGLAVVGAGAIAVAIKGVRAFSEFDATMRSVQVQTGGSVKALSDLAIEMGQKTVFSAQDAALAMLELSKSGMNGAIIKGGALQSTLKLAAAGGLDMANAATYMTNSMNAFGLGAKDTNKIVTALAGGANASTASVESLGLGLAQSAAGARNAGLTLNDTVGVLAAFDNAGIKGSDAGTSLKTMLQRLVPQTKKAANTMHDLGINFTNADGSFKSISDVAQILQDKLGGMTQAQQAQTLQTLFGSDATRAATVLMREGAKGVDKYKKATTDSSAAQKMANARMTGLHGAIENLKGSAETFAIVLGRALAPAVITIANYLSQKVLPAMVRFISFVQSNWPKIQAVIARGWAAIKPVLTQLGSFVLGIVQKYWPVVQRTIATVVTAVVGFIRSHWTQIKTIVMGVFSAVVLVVGTAVRNIVALVKQYGPGLVAMFRQIVGTILTYVRKNWPLIKDTIINVLNTAKKLIGAVLEIILMLWNKFGRNIMNQVKIYFTLAITIIRGAMKVIRGIINVVMGLLHGDWGRAWDGIKQILSGVWQIIGGIVKAAFKTLKNAFDLGKKILSAAAGRIKDGIVSAFSNLGSLIKDAFIGGLNGVIGALNDFIGLIKHIPGLGGIPLIPTIGGGGGGKKGPKSIGGAGINRGVKGPVPTFANGGVMPGYKPGHDTKLARVSPGEGMIIPEAVRALGGPAAIHAINNRFNKRKGRSGQNPPGQFLFGGIVGKAWDGVKAGARGVKNGAVAAKDFTANAVKKGARWALQGAAKVAHRAINALPIPDMVKSMGNGLVDRIAGGSEGKANKAIKDQKSNGSPVDYKPSAGVAQWKGTVLKALKLVGQPASLLNTVLRRMNQESGGNPNIFNNWDSNAKRGTPSGGLMQTIKPTFDAYRLPSLSSNMLNPLANIVASMRYAMSRYGSLSSAYDRAGGYAKGTGKNGAKKGWAWVGERGRELVNFGGGETVLNNRDSMKVSRGYADGTIDLRNLAKYLASAFRSLRGGSSADRLSEVRGNTTTRIKDKISGVVGASNDTINQSRSSLASLRKATNSELAKMAKDRQKAYDKIAKAQATLNDKKATATQRRTARTNIAQANKDIQRSLADRQKLLDRTSKQSKQLGEAITGAQATKAAAERSGNLLLKAADAVNKKLAKLASERDKISQKLSDARSFSADISANARDGAIAGAASQSVGGFKTNLSLKINSVKKFISLLRQMSHKGYNKAIMSQVVAAGVQDGSNLASVLVKASRSDVKVLNGDVSALNYQSGILGNVGTSASLGKGASTDYIGSLVRQKGAKERQLSAEERKGISVFQGATIIVRNDAQIQALAKQAAFAVSR